MMQFFRHKRSLALALALLLSFSLFGCTTEELETAGEIIGAVAEIADAARDEQNTADGEAAADDGKENITKPPTADQAERPAAEEEPVEQPVEPTEPEDKPEAQPEEEARPAIDRDGIYTSKEDVALYLWTYGELPRNFMTKKEARKLGWPGGGLDDYAQDMCIGGDTFGNREGLLPGKYKYIECDIDTLNADDRGPKRIVFSKGCEVIYYTPDHYKSFELLYGEE